MKKISLNNDWKLCYLPLNWKADQLHRVKKHNDFMDITLPCDIHNPLIENGKIPNPIISDNFNESLWVEEKSWWFKKEIEVSSELLEGKRINLVLERLDYMGDIFLNDIHIGTHKSVFFPFVKDIKEYLFEGKNTLYVRVTTGLEYVSQDMLTDMLIAPFWVDSRDEYKRPMLRKPQYVFGWDWCPRIPTCGITGDAYLEVIDDVCIRNVHISTVDISDKATIKVSVETENIENFKTYNGTVDVKISLDGKVVKSVSGHKFIKGGIDYKEFYIDIENPQLWWPNGVGAQPIYTADVTLTVDGKVHHIQETFGIRTLELCTEPINEEENEFALSVNGKKIFLKGGNWVPSETIYSNITAEKISKLIYAAKDLNFNCLRIWGGAVYENDAFYKTCDELGIIIWHDFAFACCMVPDHNKEYVDLVREEMDYQLKRLRNHPSLAIWCGSNENHMFFEIWQEKYGLENFGGKYIYNYLAPEMVHNICPEIPYWNSSPYGGDTTGSVRAGDIHGWHSLSSDYETRMSLEIYDRDTAKLVSEYGFLGPCCKKSINQYMGTDEIDMESPQFVEHINTADMPYEKKGGYTVSKIKEFYGIENPSLDEYILYGSIIQGYSMEYSIDAHRSYEHCGGNLLWMYNDCWGETGWTPIDYYLRKKPSYYYVRRAYTAKRMAVRAKDDSLYLHIINDTDEEIKTNISYGYTSFDGSNKDSYSVKITAGKGITKIKLDKKPKNYDLTKGIIFARAEAEEINDAIYYSEELRFKNIAKTNVSITDLKIEGNDTVVTVKADGYAQGVYIEELEELNVSDLYFDLMPGDSKTITIKNAKIEKPVLGWVNR